LTTPRPGSRFFVSYSHRSEEDGGLASALLAGLESAGHEVFIDRGMKLGTDWVAEIERRIDWCDFLIVLLSEASIHSEMVLGEVRMAHRKRRQDGRPGILPLRVCYDGPLDYELDSYLARVQYVRWDGAADTPQVLSEIVAVAAPDQLRQAAEAPAAFRPAPVENHLGRPQPSEDLRPLFPPPGGTIRLNDDFYLRRRADDLVEQAAKRSGETLMIKAPRQFGKSSLLVRYLAKCRDAGKPFALVDFQSFTDAQLDDYPTLLSQLAKLLIRGLRFKQAELPEIRTQADLMMFIEDQIIPQVHGHLTLAFDEVDRVLGRHYQGDFFTMLRLWHNRRAEPLSAWESVDLALVVATEPYLLIDSRDRSPFNVAIPIEPQPFERDSLDVLDGQYGGILSPSERNSLHDLLAGHPFLTRLAYYRLGTGQSPSFQALDKSAAEPDGPFGDHLRAMLVLLQQQPGLLDAMRQVIAQGSVSSDEIYYRLHGAGLARRQNRRVNPANLLYARFFKGLA
jgi:AAA-like domain/TIR domain